MLFDVNVMRDNDWWMTPIYNFLTKGEFTFNQKKVDITKRRACFYVLVQDKVYRQGFSIPLLECVEETQVPYILQEIHEGTNVQHLGGISLTQKALRAGYYLPTMLHDAKEHIKKCDK